MPAGVKPEGHAGPTEDTHMSGTSDKAAGMANEAAGKIKKGVGEASALTSFKAKGQHKNSRVMRNK